ncbi:MAG: NADH-quinone oxidoreductase subunit J [Nitrososphaerota archaeon]|nr:NADH-quinone oxidoreductase subunit J [Nitrososphaerota archaeon]MDG6921904.1 NADH-quinone oxidoreductase subunit J [Nitrososphaerota archaeon]
MIEEDIAFVVISALTIGSAIVALEARQVVYGAIGLAFSFLGVAGLFIVLDATFVALFQIIVYIGAVAVLILFTVMLVTKDVESQSKREPLKPVGIIIAVVIAVLIAVVASVSNLSVWYDTGSYSGSIVSGIGSLLTSQYALPLEVLGLVLGASIVGALTLAKLEKE